MKLYRASFGRVNFHFTPPLRQSADVLLLTDTPFEDECLDRFDEELWAAMWEQNPHWEKPGGPYGLGGWSSVSGGNDITEIEQG